jgi:hypothetical protein
MTLGFSAPGAAAFSNLGGPTHYSSTQLNAPQIEVGSAATNTGESLARFAIRFQVVSKYLILLEATPGIEPG